MTVAEAGRWGVAHDVTAHVPGVVAIVLLIEALIDLTFVAYVCLELGFYFLCGNDGGHWARFERSSIDFAPIQKLIGKAQVSRVAQLGIRAILVEENLNRTHVLSCVRMEFNLVKDFVLYLVMAIVASEAALREVVLHVVAPHVLVQHPVHEVCSDSARELCQL